MKKDELLKQFQDAVARFEESIAIDEKKNPLAIDGTLQRFEFCFELAWKCVKALFASQGKDCISPKDCLQAAYRAGWIENEEGWLKLLDCRNLTVHTYDYQKAYQIYLSLKKLDHQLFRKLLYKLLILNPLTS